MVYLFVSRVLPVKGIRPGYRHVCLRNESGQMLSMATLFILVRVYDYVPNRLLELADALANPIKYQSEADKRGQALKVLQIDAEPDQQQQQQLQQPVRKTTPQQQLLPVQEDANAVFASASANVSIPY